MKLGKTLEALTFANNPYSTLEGDLFLGKQLAL